MPRIPQTWIHKPDNTEYGHQIKVILSNKTEFKMSNIHHDERQGLTDEVRIDYILDFSNESQPNIGVIKLWQLANKDIDQFVVGDKLLLQDGWFPETEHQILALDLTIEKVEETIVTNYRRSVDVTVGDGTDTTLQKITSYSFPPGSKVSDIAPVLTKDLEMKKEHLDLTRDFVYEKGLAHWGSPFETYKLLGRDSKSDFFVWNNRPFLVNPKNGIKTDIELSPKIGLIGVQRMIITERRLRGWRVRNLLEPGIFPDAIIKIKDSTITPPGKEIDVRVLRGRFVEDNLHHSVTIDVVRAGDIEP